MIIHSNRKNFLYIFCKDISSLRNNWNPGFFSIFHLSDAVNEYNGIWACSSILHLPKKELRSVLQKMCIALKDNGMIYTSFKYGNFAGDRNGRYFTDFIEDSFQKIIADISELKIEDCWITSDVRPGRDEEKWLNLLLRKSNIH